MKRTTRAAALIALAGCCGPVIAADGMPAVKATDLIGMEVRNDDGAELGRIQDLVVDLDDNRVRYAIMDSRSKLHRYSLAQFELAPGKGHVLLDFPQQRLEDSPGMAPDWKAGAGLVRASDLIGWNVQDRNGKGIGELTEVLISASGGTVLFAAVDLDEDQGPGRRAIPVDAFRIRDESLVLALDPSQLQQASSFTGEELQRNLDDRAFVERHAKAAAALTS